MEYNKAYLTKAGRIGAAEMKVLMIPSWYPTAEAPLLGTFYKEQAEALAARGVDMAVLYVNVSGDFHPAHNGIHRDDAGGVLTYTYVHPNLTPRWEKGRCIQRTRMLEKLYRRLEKEWGRPDVVNLRSSLQGYEAAALCRRHGLPLFFMEHSSYVVTEGPDSEAVRRLHAVMDAATVNACVSSVLYKVMAPYRETRIIPDFVDDSRFIIQETAPRETFTFRAMGQLRPIKGHDTLIRAFALLKKMTDRPVCLEIAGKGVLHDNLQKLIDQLGIADNCRLVGATALCVPPARRCCPAYSTNAPRAAGRPLPPAAAARRILSPRKPGCWCRWMIPRPWRRRCWRCSTGRPATTGSGSGLASWSGSASSRYAGS